jgi:phosphate transport system regulatory protein PhoU
MLAGRDGDRAPSLVAIPTLARANRGSRVQDNDRPVAHLHREVFDRELLAVKEGIVRMGERVAAALDAAVAALTAQDVAAARALIAADGAINDAQAELTSLIITTIATQSPVARDLRFLIALAHVSYELERIGDHAVGVARQVTRVGSGVAIGTASLVRMGELASGLLHGVLRALVDLDQEEARRVASGDDEIDRLYHAYFERALERMRADPSWVDKGAHLLFAAKDLERIGDRVTNIAEEVVFLATGEIEDLNP